MARPPSKGDEGPEGDAAVANPTYIGTELAAERVRRRDGGGGDDGGAEPPPGSIPSRVAHLEHRMGSVEGKLDTIISQLGSMANRAEMRNYLFLAVGSFVAVAGLLIAGLGWLETRVARVQPPQAQQAAPSQPIIIQVPYPQNQPATPSAPPNNAQAPKK